jgi:hypothetical protein
LSCRLEHSAVKYIFKSTSSHFAIAVMRVAGRNRRKTDRGNHRPCAGSERPRRGLGRSRKYSTSRYVGESLVG